VNNLEAIVGVVALVLAILSYVYPPLLGAAVILLAGLILLEILRN
jgi:hypothetical protein